MFLAVLIPTFLSLVFFLSGFLAQLASLPIGIALVRRGWGAALQGAALSLGLLFLLYQLPKFPFLPFKSLPGISPAQAAGLAMVSLVSYIWIGLALAWEGLRAPGAQGSGGLKLEPPGLASHLALPVASAKEPHPLEASVGRVFLSTTAVVVLGLLVLSRITGMEAPLMLEKTIQSSLSQIISLNEQRVGAGEELAFLKEWAPRIGEGLFRLFPGLMAAFAFVTITLNFSMLRRWARPRVIFSGTPEFSVWRLPEFSIWVPIAMGATYFLNHYLLKIPWLSVVLQNLMILLLVVYLYQGMAILSFWFRRKLSPFLRLFGYLVILLFLQAVGIFLIILGLFDFWFDFRRLKKLR